MRAQNNRHLSFRHRVQTTSTNFKRENNQVKRETSSGEQKKKAYTNNRKSCTKIAYFFFYETKYVVDIFDKIEPKWKRLLSMYVNDLYKYFEIVGQIGRCVGSAGNEVVESFHFILTHFILGGEKKQ